MDWENYIVLANILRELHADKQTDDDTKKRLALKFCKKMKQIENFSFSEKDLDIHLEYEILFGLGLAKKCCECGDIKYLLEEK